MQKVVLDSVPNGYYQSNTQHPQKIIARSPNQTFCFLDSEQAALEKNKTNINLSDVKHVGDYAGTLLSGANLISVIEYEINYISPNVNPRNNIIRFKSSNHPSTIFNVIVSEGFYYTSTDLIAAIVSALNTATGVTGLTFSSAVIANFPDMYDLISSGGNYYILDDCLAITRGKFLWNLPSDAIYTNTKRVGIMGLLYTRYIDICSSTLTRYLINDSNGNPPNINVLFRSFKQTPQSDFTGSPSYNPPTVLYRFDQNITNIDFQIKDEFGDFLYLPVENNNSSFFFLITLKVEY